MFTQVVLSFGIRIEDVLIITSRKLSLGLGLINFFSVVKISHLSFFSKTIFALTGSFL